MSFSFRPSTPSTPFCHVPKHLPSSPVLTHLFLDLHAPCSPRPSFIPRLLAYPLQSVLAPHTTRSSPFLVPSLPLFLLPFLFFLPLPFALHLFNKSRLGGSRATCVHHVFVTVSAGGRSRGDGRCRVAAALIIAPIQTRKGGEGKGGYGSGWNDKRHWPTKGRSTADGDEMNERETVGKSGMIKDYTPPDEMTDKAGCCRDVSCEGVCLVRNYHQRPENGWYGATGFAYQAGRAGPERRRGGGRR